MKKTTILTVALLAAVAVLAVGAVAAFAAKSAGDLTPPVTTSDVRASDDGEDVSFSFHATDASGVSYVYYRIDKSVLDCSVVPTDTVHTEWDVMVDPPVLVAAVDPHPEMVPLPIGSHTLKYWSQDTEGNVEAQHEATFVVNPVVYLGAKPTSVKAGKTIVLSGTLAPAMAAELVLSVKAPGAKSYKVVATVETDAKGAYSLKYKMPAKGTWWFRTSFTDPATAMKASSIPETVTVK